MEIFHAVELKVPVATLQHHVCLANRAETDPKGNTPDARTKVAACAPVMFENGKKERASPSPPQVVPGSPQEQQHESLEIQNKNIGYFLRTCQN